MFRKLIAMVLAVIMCMSLSITAFAAQLKKPQERDTLSVISSNEKLDLLKWHDYHSLDTLSIEDTYSYDELISYLRKEGFTREEALSFAGERPLETRAASTTIRYSLFKMDTFTYNNKYKLQPRFRVGLEYISGVATPNRIVSLGNAVMYTGAGSKCSFAGTLGYELIAGNEIYYDFFGDIYRQGNIKWSTGLTVGIGKYVSIEGTISNGQGYETNVSDSGTYYSEALDP